MSRIALICSSYINRQNGDSLELFNSKKDDASNDPYWYGFLISYRSLLTICSQIESNLRKDIAVPDPDQVNVSVEAFVQFGAGIDEKHHQHDIETMATYINSATSVVSSTFVPELSQGGGGPVHKDCYRNLRSATFGASLASLESELLQVRTDDCGIAP